MKCQDLFPLKNKKLSSAAVMTGALRIIGNTKRCIGVTVQYCILSQPLLLADDKLVIPFLFFSEKRLWHFMQIINMKCQNVFSGKKKKRKIPPICLQ